MYGEKTFVINERVIKVEDVVNDIVKNMTKDRLWDYPVWFDTFLHMKEPQNIKNYNWKVYVQLRGLVRRAINSHFVNNKMPYWLKIIPKKGYVLFSTDVAKVIMAERIKRGHGNAKMSSEICKGIGHSNLPKKDANLLKTASTKFFTPIEDMYVGRAARMKLSENKVLKLLSAGKNIK